MKELWKQERHFSNLLHSGINLDSLVAKKDAELYGLIGSEWKEVMNGMTVLNVGCGPIPLRFKSKREIGIDPLIEFYAGAYPKKYLEGMEPIKGFASKIPLPDGHVDFVYCNNALEYMDDWEKSLAEMARVLKRGGHLALIYHSFQNDGINLCILRQVDMYRYLRSMGFDVLKHTVSSEEHVKIFARKL